MLCETPIFDKEVGNYGAYINEDIRFYNSELATNVGKYFRKHGRYPYPPPTPKDDNDKHYYSRFKDSSKYDEYKKFWDIEENNRRNGIIIPGRLLSDGTIQKIHITGHHYSYLNYTTILHDDTVNNGKKEFVLKNKPTFAKQVGASKSSTPDFWDGDYHYFKAVDLAKTLGLNLVVDKTRQVGYSYKNSSIAVDMYDLIPKSTTIIGAYSEDYLVGGEATFEMAKNKINHINAFTDWRKSIMGTGVGSVKEIKSGYVYANSKIKDGFKSIIIPVVFAKNPGAARGKKGFLVMLEEAGKFPNLKESVIMTNKGLREGNIVTGIMIIFGTGGGTTGDWEDFEEIFYNPLDYDCLPFKNVWDEGMGHTASGFFHGRQYNLKPYYDKDGNSDIVKSIAYINGEREKWKKAGKEDLYKKNIAEQPITPKESFDGSNDNIFNSPQLIEQVAKVEHDPEFNFGINGLFIAGKDGVVSFKPNNELKKEWQHPPILSGVRHSGEDVEGCVTIWYYPFKDRSGNIPNKLYYLIHDPYAVSKEKGTITTKHSLGCSYIYESTNNFTSGFGDRIVAKYMGRPHNIDEHNKQVFMLAKYYGCTDRQIWFESNRGSEVLNYAKKNKFLSWLAYDTNVDSNKTSETNKVLSYGFNLSPNRKLAAVKYLYDWLYQVRGVSTDNNQIFNLSLIIDSRLLYELQKWHLLGNFDAVSTMLVLMFLIEDIKKKNEYAKLNNTDRKKELDNSIFNPIYLINKNK